MNALNPIQTKLFKVSLIIVRQLKGIAIKGVIFKGHKGILKQLFVIFKY